jgi:hypothetical protein
MNKKKESCCNKEKWIRQIKKQGELLKQVHRWQIGRGGVGIKKMNTTNIYMMNTNANASTCSHKENIK